MSVELLAEEKRLLQSHTLWLVGQVKYALAMIVAVWIDLLILMPKNSGIAASQSFTGQLEELVDVLSG